MIWEETYSRAGYKTSRQDVPNYVTSYCMYTNACIHRKRPTLKDESMVTAVISGGGRQSDWRLFLCSVQIVYLPYSFTYGFRIWKKVPFSYPFSCNSISETYSETREQLAPKEVHPSSNLGNTGSTFHISLSDGPTCTACSLHNQWSLSSKGCEELTRASVWREKGRID